jgi:predicted esterase
MGGGLPLLVGLHPQGDTAARYFDAFEYLAGRTKVIAALPQGQIPFNRGYEWGSVSNAEALILEAVNNVRAKSLIDPNNTILMGFSDSANLACSVALRNVVPVSAVVAFGPFIDSVDIAQLPPHTKTLRRVVVLCAEDDPGFQRCEDSATLLKAEGVVVILRKMDAESARFGRDRMREALNLTLERER